MQMQASEDGFMIQEIRKSHRRIEVLREAAVYAPGLPCIPCWVAAASAASLFAKLALRAVVASAR